MAGFYGQTYETIGCEYESLSKDIEEIQVLLSRTLPRYLGEGWRNVVVTSDASVQFKSEKIYFGNKRFNVSIHTPAYRNLPGAGNNGTKVMGFELYILPNIIPDFERIVHPLFAILESSGDFTSHRASIHFHAGFPNNLTILQNMVRIGLHIDPVLYRLGGMGGTHRGYSNKYNYCRPMLNSAVVMVAGSSKKKSYPEGPIPRIPRTLEELREEDLPRRYTGSSMGKIRWVKVSNPVASLEAKTAEEFWACFGIDYTQNISVKYHPVRYAGINFFAVPKHKTMEFRHFNQSLDASLVVATGKFSRCTMELASRLSKRESYQFEMQNPFQEISMGQCVSSIERIVGLCQEKEIENLPSERELQILFETIENSRVETIPKNPVKTHIDSFTIDPYLVHLGKLEEVESPAESNHTDIHNIQDKSLYDERI